MAANGAPTILINSTRSVNKATYVPTRMPAGTRAPGQALVNGLIVRQLRMTAAEHKVLAACSPASWRKYRSFCTSMIETSRATGR
jgi:hypothetical protein